MPLQRQGSPSPAKFTFPVLTVAPEAPEVQSRRRVARRPQRREFSNIRLHFMHYNFCRVHTTLGTTPAVAAGVTDHVWTLDEIVALLEEAETYPIKRGTYKKRSASHTTTPAS